VEHYLVSAVELPLTHINTTTHSSGLLPSSFLSQIWKCQYNNKQINNKQQKEFGDFNNNTTSYWIRGHVEQWLIFGFGEKCIIAGKHRREASQGSIARKHRRALKEDEGG
jgi:hypothetical protein